MELSTYLIGLIDSKPAPVVICDLDYRIIFMNAYAKTAYEKFGGEALIGQLLYNHCGLEAKTKIDMIIEYFKENKDQNYIFGYHEDKNNTDIYIVAIRDSNKELIGFTSMHESRTPDTSLEYYID
ncbi:MAG: PAS domain-containing protein [Ruminococcus sp.]|nr:PAS domain-containing protein [Ruminococcus sp.]